MNIYCPNATITNYSNITPLVLKPKILKSKIKLLKFLPKQPRVSKIRPLKSVLDYFFRNNK